MKQGRRSLIIVVLLLWFANPVFAGYVSEGNSGNLQIWDVLKPGAGSAHGTVSKIWKQRTKTGYAPVLSNIKSETFEQWENAKKLLISGNQSLVDGQYNTIVEETIPNVTLFKDALTYVIMGIMATDNANRLVIDRPRDSQIDADDPMYAAWQAEQEAQAKKWRDAATLIREWYEVALRDPSRSQGWDVQPELRQAFWERAGIYKKFNTNEIEYLNQIVIPAIAASIVTSNQGLLDLWRAINFVNYSEDTSVGAIGAEPTGHALPGSSRDNLTEGLSLEEIMDLYNGSTLSLGLLYQASGTLGSGTGDYGSQTSGMLDFMEAALIPLREKPKIPPPPPDEGEAKSYESFKWTYRITK